jgi:hypothetical protein
MTDVFDNHFFSKLRNTKVVRVSTDFGVNASLTQASPLGGTERSSKTEKYKLEMKNQTRKSIRTFLRTFPAQIFEIF